MVILKNDLLVYNYSLSRFQNTNEPLIAEKVDLSKPNRADRMLHCHDFPQIWYCIDGFFSITVDDNTYDMHPGNLIVIPPGAMHSNFIPDAVSPYAFRVNIRYDILNEKEEEAYLNLKIHLFMGKFRSKLRLDEHILIVLPQEIRNEAEDIFSHLCISNLPEINLSTEEKLNKLDALFSLPGLIFSEKTKERARILWQQKIHPIINAIEYINKNFSKKILADDMLKLTFLGYSTFFETFKKFINCSFATYLQIIRLKNAHSMMAATSFPIAQIALMCGFNSHSHMEGAYKKFSGVVPTRARAHSKEWAIEWAKQRALQKNASDN